jgi:hypothetical protein
VKAQRATRYRGAVAVARQALGYSRLGLVMRPVLVNGAAGVVSTRDGRSSRSAASPSSVAGSSLDLEIIAT